MRIHSFSTYTRRGKEGILQKRMFAYKEGEGVFTVMYVCKIKKIMIVNLLLVICGWDFKLQSLQATNTAWYRVHINLANYFSLIFNCFPTLFPWSFCWKVYLFPWISLSKKLYHHISPWLWSIIYHSSEMDWCPR